MSAATMNELEQLWAGRDSMQQQLNEALEREAALAAHVEAQKNVLEKASAMGFFTICHDSKTDHKQLCRKVAALLEKTPAIDLTKRDLIKQAEALEEFANNANPNCDAQDAIVRQVYDDANTLREQAKGLL